MGRYDGLPTLTQPVPELQRYASKRDAPGSGPRSYLSRRFLPQPSALPQSSTYAVQADQRLDQIAAATLGDPSLYWQICDANNAMAPDALVSVPGRRLRIPVPQAGGHMALVDSGGVFE